MELEDNGNLKLEIDEPKGWCPKIGEKFYASHYSISSGIVVDEFSYDGSTEHRFIMRQGGCYKTYEEAYNAEKELDNMIEAVMARFDNNKG